MQIQSNFALLGMLDDYLGRNVQHPAAERFYPAETEAGDVFIKFANDLGFEVTKQMSDTGHFSIESTELIAAIEWFYIQAWQKDIQELVKQSDIPDDCYKSYLLGAIIRHGSIDGDTITIQLANSSRKTANLKDSLVRLYARIIDHRLQLSYPCVNTLKCEFPELAQELREAMLTLASEMEHAV